MNKKNNLHILLLILTSISVACGNKFESKSINSANEKVTTGLEHIAEEESDLQPSINPPEIIIPEVVPPLVDEPIIGAAQEGNDTLTEAQTQERLGNALYKQVDSAIQVQTTSRQSRPQTLPTCENIDQLTSLFGCSMYVFSGLRQVKKLTADVKVYLADPSKKTIDKVAFIVASHNFENPISINHETRYTSHPIGAKKIYDELAVKGVSVVFIGFGYKDFYLNSIFDKAQATARVIRLINNLKTTDDPSFLIGLSLGGVIGRIALNNLEATGENLHNVNHYVSFDSPHKGAHIPIGLQHILEFLEQGTNKAKTVGEKFQDNFGGFIGNILNQDRLIDQLEEGIALATFFYNKVNQFSDVYLNSDFAQELVIQQISKEESNYTHSAYTRLQNHLNRTGMPKMTVANIGVTNGSITGNALPLIGNRYLSLNTSLKNYIEIDLISSIAKSSSDHIFQGMFRYPDPEELGGLFGGNGTDTFNYTKVQGDNIADLDRSTCGYLNAVGDIEKVIALELKKMFDEPLVITNRLACFIPTSSGLASTKNVTYKGPMSAQDSLFDEIIGGSKNTHHLDFTTEISSGILSVVKRSY